LNWKNEKEVMKMNESTYLLIQSAIGILQPAAQIAVGVLFLVGINRACKMMYDIFGMRDKK